jgi:peptide/nickel transport system substrate-binding protein
MAQLKSDFAQAGIALDLVSNPSFEEVIGNATPCTAGKSCGWDIEYWGYGWIYAPDFYPTGDQLWASAAPSNYGGWHDPMTDHLIAATEAGALPAMYPYEDYLARQLPVIWLPTQYLQLSMIDSRLVGTQPQDPLGNLTPENWYWR